MVLYIFGIIDIPFVKIGFTNHCPWSRACDGHQKNSYPNNQRGKLGLYDLKLLTFLRANLDDQGSMKFGLLLRTKEF